MAENNNRSKKSRKKLNVLTFLLNKALLAIPVSDIREVNRMAEIGVVQNTPDYVLGLINFHGETTPVLNLKKLLLIEPSPLNEKGRWLAVKSGKTFVCLGVDELGGFMELDCETFDETPFGAPDFEDKYIKCYARVKKNLIPVLEVKNIISPQERTVLRKLAKKNKAETEE